MNLVYGLALHELSVAQWIECPPGVSEVIGSNPIEDLEFFFVPRSWHAVYFIFTNVLIITQKCDTVKKKLKGQFCRESGKKFLLHLGVSAYRVEYSILVNARVVDVSEIERVSAACKWDFWYKNECVNMFVNILRYSSFYQSLLFESFFFNQLLK